MASSRDDFIIAIRSAFLKKSTKQKFSLLTLVFSSIFIIVLSNLNFKVIDTTRNVINEIVYRSSFVVSIPENFIINSYFGVKEYTNFYNKYQKDKVDLDNLRSKNILSEIIISENKELKNLIEDYTLTSNKILAKVIVDHESPFLKTIIINKGSADKIKIGTNIYDKNYLVGRVIEVNFKSARVLLLSDLNSSVPVSIVPGNIQAIVTGNGQNSGDIKYIRDNMLDDIESSSIAYTSGTGSIFKSGIPVGRISFENDELSVNYYSDLSQLKYVFAEIEQNEIVIDNNSLEEIGNSEKIKLDLLNDQLAILNESNSKFINENNFLKSKINELENNILVLNNNIKSQKIMISQNDIDKKELEFLRLNLIHSSKCLKTAFKKGFKVGTPEYKKCILDKAKNR